MLKRKTTLCTLLILLFLLTSTYLSTTIIASPAKPTDSITSNTSTTSTILRFQQNHSNSLQQCLTTAPAGAIIQLAAGLYTEILTIDKPLHLKGEQQDTIICVISPQNGYAIRITAAGVILSNLTVINQGPGLYTTAVKIEAPHTTIQDCVLSNTPIGLAIWSSQNHIERCIFQGCDDEGIALLGTAASPVTHNRISHCVFQENCDGIELQYASDNIIEHCRFLYNTHAGIDAIESHNDNNIITSCEFIHNQAFGVYIARSSNNQITHCMFQNDTLMLMNAQNTTLRFSSLAHIHLMEHSSLFIEHCEPLKTTTIRAQQSSFYEVRSQQSEQGIIAPNNPATRHRLLSTVLTQLAALRARFDMIRFVRI